jgi:hypothetical protein
VYESVIMLDRDQSEKIFNVSISLIFNRIEGFWVRNNERSLKRRASHEALIPCSGWKICIYYFYHLF